MKIIISFQSALNIIALKLKFPFINIVLYNKVSLKSQVEKSLIK